jgi:hypothetical protein
LSVSEDLVTYQEGGFSLPLNAYPPPGQLSQGQTLNWLQYIIDVENGYLAYEIQYWAVGAATWPPGYTPVPNTTPWLPAWPNDFQLTWFGNAPFTPSNRIPRGSTFEIKLTTNADGNITSALFSFQDPSGRVSNATVPFPPGAQYPICAFELNLVAPGGGANTTLISAAGVLTYSVSPGSLSVQHGGAGAACGELHGGTAEGSNAAYGAMTPSSGPTLRQSLSYLWQGTAAVSGSALDGYWLDGDNSQHVHFLSLGGHVHELYIHPQIGWIDDDLTALANGAPAAPGTALDGYSGSDRSQHVNFLSLDGHVHELYIRPGAAWVDHDLSGQTV